MEVRHNLYMQSNWKFLGHENILKTILAYNERRQIHFNKLKIDSYMTKLNQKLSGTSLFFMESVNELDQNKRAINPGSFPWVILQ